MVVALPLVLVETPDYCWDVRTRTLGNNALRILIVDDHEAVRKGVCAILSARLDIEVCGEAVNGKEAIEKTKELKPDLIILDVTMPVLNGFDAAREIRKILPASEC